MSKGCIVLHGLTGTPAVVSSVTDVLDKAGFYVKAPLLPGHGTAPEDLMNISWEDWYKVVVGVYEEMRGRVDKIYCAGASIGSLLILKLAIDYKRGIKGLCCISTPLRLAAFVRVVFPLVWNSPIKHFYRFQSKDYAMSVADPDGREEYKKCSYDRIPLRAVAEVRMLQESVREGLNRMTTPLLLVHAVKDTVAPISNVEEVKKLIRSTTVEELIFKRSRHVVTLDYEKGEAAKGVLDFFNRFS